MTDYCANPMDQYGCEMRRGGFSKALLAITIGAISTLVIFPSIAQSDVAGIFDPNEGWTTPSAANVLGTQAMLFSDNSSLGGPGESHLVKNGFNPNGNNPVDPTCSSTTDKQCDLSNYDFMATIPNCISTSDVNCIAEVGAIDGQGKKLIGSFSRYFPDKAQNEYVGNPEWNLPSGTAGSIFNIAGAENPAGKSYYVDVKLVGRGSHSASSQSISLQGFTASITPIQLLDSGEQFKNMFCMTEPRVCNPGFEPLIFADGVKFWGRGGGTTGGGVFSCAASSWGENLCAQKQAFPADLRFYVKLRLTLMPSGWLHGRMSSPDITIVTTGKVNELTVTASPIKVPLLYSYSLWNDMKPELQNLYDSTNGQYKKSSHSYAQSGIVPDPSKRIMTSAPSPYDSNGMDELIAWLPSMKNTATAMPSYWSVRSLSGAELQTANSCFTNPNQLNGIVTTNSTQYSAGPPAFNKDEGFLSYKVASPHFTSSGDVFKGSYDLAMRSDVARCIYGFSKAPVSAIVSVVSSDGTPQVATTIFSEKEGWVYLSAKNFEYSSPSVRVKLEQEKPAPAKTAETAQVAAPMKTTITCIKNKLVKKVTAPSPKCPTGYKKK